MEGSLLHFTSETEHHEVCRQTRSNLSAFGAGFGILSADMVRLDVYSLFNSAFCFLMGLRRAPLLRKFADEKGFHYQESFDPSELGLYELKFHRGGDLHNAISGVIGNTKFVYFEQDIGDGDRESALAFQLTSERFSPPSPPMFGFLSARSNSYCFFWWDEYLVPLKEMDAFFNQGLKAYEAAVRISAPQER